MKLTLISFTAKASRLALPITELFSDYSKRGRRAVYGSTAVILGLLVVGLPIKSFAQFGGIVFDPSSYATLGHIWSSDISMYAKMIQEFQQLVKIYQTDMQVYQMSVAMAQMVSHPSRLNMMTLGPTFVNDATGNKYGENQNWSSMINGNPGAVQGAWAASTLTMGQNPYLSLEHLGSSVLLAKLASVEQTDGAAIRCNQVIAQYNQHTQQNMSAVKLLKAAGLDISGPMNAVVAQLNLVNSGAEQARMEAQSQGSIQACLAQQQMIANKQQRDNDVENLNFIGILQNYDRSENDTWTDGASALQNFRLP